MKNLKLYYSSLCPFCTELVKYVKEKELDIELMDGTKDMEIQKEIYRLGGKSQVPMLTIDGEAMYESNDIMEWLEKNM